MPQDVNAAPLTSTPPPVSARAMPHWKSSSPKARKTLSKLFALDPDKFQSPAGVHTALSELFTLLVEDRVSARRAAVLAYISSLLLRTLSAVQQEEADQAAAAKNRPVRILWNIPRPSHERHGAVNPAPAAGSPEAS